MTLTIMDGTLQKEQRITKEDMGQLLSAFPCLMRIKYSFQTEEGKEKTENQERLQPSKQEARFSSLITSHHFSSPKMRKEGNSFKLGTETFTRTSSTPPRTDVKTKFKDWRHCFKTKKESPTIHEG